MAPKVLSFGPISAVVGPAGGHTLGTLRRTAVQQHHVRMLGMDLIELVPDQADIVEVDAAGEGDLRPGVWRQGSRDCR
jgi:hypothetical protein